MNNTPLHFVSHVTPADIRKYGAEAKRLFQSGARRLSNVFKASVDKLNEDMFALRSAFQTSALSPAYAYHYAEPDVTNE